MADANGLSQERVAAVQLLEILDEQSCQEQRASGVVDHVIDLAQHDERLFEGLGGSKRLPARLLYLSECGEVRALALAILRLAVDGQTLLEVALCLLQPPASQRDLAQARKRSSLTVAVPCFLRQLQHPTENRFRLRQAAHISPFRTRYGHLAAWRWHGL